MPDVNKIVFASQVEALMKRQNLDRYNAAILVAVINAENLLNAQFSALTEAQKQKGGKIVADNYPDFQPLNKKQIIEEKTPAQEKTGLSEHDLLLLRNFDKEVTKILDDHDEKVAGIFEKYHVISDDPDVEQMQEDAYLGAPMVLNENETARKDTLETAISSLLTPTLSTGDNADAVESIDSATQTELHHILNAVVLNMSKPGSNDNPLVNKLASRLRELGSDLGAAFAAARKDGSPEFNAQLGEVIANRFEHRQHSTQRPLLTALPTEFARADLEEQMLKRAKGGLRTEQPSTFTEHGTTPAQSGKPHFPAGGRSGPGH